jgi:glycerophosphoryl diester phosphodiesterase
MTRIKMKIVNIDIEHNEYITSGNIVVCDDSIVAYLESENHDRLRVSLYKIEDIEKAKQRLPKIKSALLGRDIYVLIDDEFAEKYVQEYTSWTRGVSGNYAEHTRAKYPTRFYNDIRNEIIGTRRRQKI